MSMDGPAREALGPLRERPIERQTAFMGRSADRKERRSVVPGFSTGDMSDAQVIGERAWYPETGRSENARECVGQSTAARPVLNEEAQGGSVWR
jgi:hypothetical protein